MKAPDLIVGEQYVLADRKWATYEGKHEGALDLADGSKYYGGAGSLRFRLADGTLRLYETARDVAESTATKLAREEAARQREAAQKVAREQALAYLRDLGFAVLDDRGAASFEDRKTHVYIASFGLPETVDEVGVDNITVGMLKKVIGERVG